MQTIVYAPDLYIRDLFPPSWYSIGSYFLNVSATVISAYMKDNIKYTIEFHNREKLYTDITTTTYESKNCNMY
jgi:hypothetical protein